MPSNKETLIKKLGSEEAYKEYMRKLASKPHRRNFDNPEIAKSASDKGHQIRWNNRVAG